MSAPSSAPTRSISRSSSSARTCRSCAPRSATDDYAPSFALLKGWRNYLCLARLHQAVGAQRTLLEQDKLDELVGLAEWSAHTADGTLSDLPVTPTPEVWDEVSAEADLCTRLKCPHFDRCFLFRARRRAADADIVVVNHHLLAADLSVRRAQDNWQEAAVLPPYSRLILDEAHHLEEVAAGHLGVQVTSRGVRRLLSRFERNGRGLAPTLGFELAARSDPPSREALEILRDRLYPALADAHRASDALFGRLYQRLGREPGGADAAGRRLRGGPDLGRGTRVRSRRLAHGLPHASRRGRDHRRPALAVGRQRATGADPGGAARRAPPARRDLGRPQPHAPACRGRCPDGPLDRADDPRSERRSSRPCRSTWRRCSGSWCSTGSTPWSSRRATLAASGEFDFLESRLGLAGRGPRP